MSGLTTMVTDRGACLAAAEADVESLAVEFIGGDGRRHGINDGDDDEGRRQSATANKNMRWPGRRRGTSSFRHASEAIELLLW
jgi:hypothetical protein